MSYVDRDTEGNIVGLYANAQREDHEFVEGATMHVPPPSPLEQIRALELQFADRQAKATRIATLKQALDWACTLPQARNADGSPKTRDEVHAIYYMVDKTYRELYDLEKECERLRKLIP